MAKDLSASFGIETEADSSETDALADSLEKVYDRMVQDQKAVADLAAGMRRLQGGAAVSTETFKQMRTELTAKKAALAQNTDAVVRLGGGMTDATKKVAEMKAARAAEAVTAKKASDDAVAAAKEQKKAQDDLAQKIIADAQKKGQEALKLQSQQRTDAKKSVESFVQNQQEALKLQSQQRTDAKKSVESFVQNQRKEHAARVETMQAAAKQKKEALDAASTQAAAANVAGAAVTGLAGVVGKAAVAIYAALAAAAAAFVYFGIQAANAARSARLLREATTGSAAGAALLDKRVAALAGRLPSTRAEIEDIGLALIRAGLSGNGLDSALSAVATTAAVMGQTAGGIIQGIAERAKQSRKFILGAFDLKGTGLQIADVAQALSKRLKISFQQAMAAIQNGQVGMEAGLAAMDDAVQKRFGKIGRLMALDLGKQLDKARENLGRLFQDLHIEPALEGLADILSLVDENTASGQALKTIFETVLNPLLDGFAAASPGLKAFFKGAIVGVLMLTVQILTLKNQIKEALGPSTFGKLDPGKMFALAALLVSYFGTAVVVSVKAVLLLVEAVNAIDDALSSAGDGFSDAGDAAKSFAGGLLDDINAGLSAAWDYIASIDLGNLGVNIMKGLVSGLKAGLGLVTGAVQGIAATIVSTFSSSMVIRSPSRRMKPYGKYTSQGVAEGIEEGADDVEDAAAAMARRPVDAVNKAGAGSGGGKLGGRAGGRSGPLIGTLIVYGVDNAEQFEGASLLDKLADAVERAARAGGANVVEVTA